jgi:hypothetical protein
MQIVMLLAPNIGDSLYTGIAVSKNGRRYLFNATPDGASCSVLRQDPRSAPRGTQCIGGKLNLLPRYEPRFAAPFVGPIIRSLSPPAKASTHTAKDVLAKQCDE